MPDDEPRTGALARPGIPEPALLEEWLRERYFTASVDISSSGVAPYSLAEVREHTGMTLTAWDEIEFRDSHSLGGEALRAALTDRFAPGQTARVMATHGSSEAIYLLLRSLLGAGDEVVVQDPGYHSLHAIATATGCHVVRWEMDLAPGRRPDVEALLGLIRPGTRMVLLNFPHNPTGLTITESEQDAVVRACAKVGAYLLWDRAFAELVYDAPVLPDPARAGDRVISVGTFSKAYGLPGLRAGWAIGDPEVLAGCVRLRDYLTLSLSPLVEHVATHAARHADRLLAGALARARRNREALRAWVEQHQPLVEWTPPAGGVTAFPYLPGVGDDRVFADRLERERGTLVVPGSCFGRPGRLRLGFGGPTEELTVGLDRLAAALREQAEQQNTRRGDRDAQLHAGA